LDSGSYFWTRYANEPHSPSIQTPLDGSMCRPSPNSVIALCTQPERVADSVIAEISVGSRASEDSVCPVQNIRSSVQNVQVNNRSVQA
jgi:hypothetical protein